MRAKDDDQRGRGTYELVSTVTRIVIGDSDEFKTNVLMGCIKNQPLNNSYLLM